MEWKFTQQQNGSLWEATVPHLSKAVIDATIERMSQDTNQRHGTILQVHWCDGFVELSVEDRLHGECRDGYRVDIDDFWAAADIEDVDEMDAVLSELREQATLHCLAATRRLLPWVKQVARYEDDVWREPDALYNLEEG